MVAANRAEWRERPTEPAPWWPDHPAIFAGRDLRAGGTWMGITRSGRFAAVTNFRDPSDKRSTARSRGELVSEFLLSSETPAAFFSRLAARAFAFNGFNLLAGDRASLWYFGSREAVAREVPPGIHGLSNHLLDEPWPKVIQGREAMAAALLQADPAPALEAFLGDTTAVDDARLPKTGVGIEWERRLSPPMITGDDYGTRCSTTILLDARGAMRVRELTRDAAGGIASIATQDERHPA